MSLIPSATIRSRLLGLLISAIGGLVVILTAVWHFSIVPALQIGVARQQAEVASRVADQIEQFIDERIQGWFLPPRSAGSGRRG